MIHSSNPKFRKSSDNNFAEFSRIFKLRNFPMFESRKFRISEFESLRILKFCKFTCDVFEPIAISTFFVHWQAWWYRAKTRQWVSFSFFVVFFFREWRLRFYCREILCFYCRIKKFYCYGLVKDALQWMLSWDWAISSRNAEVALWGIVEK